MHSSQVNFYLTPGDEAALVERLAAKTDFIMIASVVNGEATAPVLRTYRPVVGGEGWIDVCLLREEHLPLVKIRYAPKPNLTFVNEPESPVIEFSRCRLHADRLQRGRFYAVKARYIGDELTKKDADFLRLVDRVMSVTRRSLIYDREGAEYYGEEAMELKKQGFDMGIGAGRR